MYEIQGYMRTARTICVKIIMNGRKNGPNVLGRELGEHGD